MASVFTNAARSALGFLKSVPGIIVAVVCVVIVGLLATGNLRLSAGPSGSGTATLPPSDVPPLELIYLDASRVDNYLGQMEGGLSKSQQRSDQVTKAISATLSGSIAAQLSASESSQQGTQETVTPTTADRFFLFLRLLRQGAPTTQTGSTGTCPKRSGLWLWQLTEPVRTHVVDELNRCVGVGRFVRLTNVQLFLPPYAQVLPNAQSATALYGGEPWARYPFTSPTQSASPALIASYARAVGSDPRMPFVAATYGSKVSIGPPSPAVAGGTARVKRRPTPQQQALGGTTRAVSARTTAKAGATSVAGSSDDVAFFVPVNYEELTTEPSLLSGAVTVVGKVIYYSAQGGPAYIDYPTIHEFGPALVNQLRHKTGLINELGVCGQIPPRQAQAHPTGRVRHIAAQPACRNRSALLAAVKHSVTLRGPYAVVLPLAIYQ